MGKSKQRSKLAKLKGGNPPQGMRGTNKAFKVSSHKATKAKHKAKAVTTNLKRLNVQNRQQVRQSDSTFAQLQKDMKTTHKEKPNPKTTAANKAQTSANTSKQELPDVDETVKQMACL